MSAIIQNVWLLERFMAFPLYHSLFVPVWRVAKVTFSKKHCAGFEVQIQRDTKCSSNLSVIFII
jgi:hypothetical protein